MSEPLEEIYRKGGGFFLSPVGGPFERRVFLTVLERHTSPLKGSQGPGGEGVKVCARKGKSCDFSLRKGGEKLPAR